MDTLAKGVVMGILLMIKLVITGACLAIGFKLGYVLYDAVEAKRKSIKKPSAQPEVAAA